MDEILKMDRWTRGRTWEVSPRYETRQQLRKAESRLCPTTHGAAAELNKSIGRQPGSFTERDKNPPLHWLGGLQAAFYSALAFTQQELVSEFLGGIKHTSEQTLSENITGEKWRHSLLRRTFVFCEECASARWVRGSCVWVLRYSDSLPSSRSQASQKTPTPTKTTTNISFRKYCIFLLLIH